MERNLASEPEFPKRLKPDRFAPITPASREQTYGWVAQLVRAVDS
jgi:hypothetical protein